MKFKTKKELIKEPMGEEYYEGEHPYHIGIKKSFKYFAERIKFYKKYESQRKLLYKEDEKIFDNWLYSKEHDSLLNFNETVANITFNMWLFNYCFGDITKDPIKEHCKEFKEASEHTGRLH